MSAQPLSVPQRQRRRGSASRPDACGSIVTDPTIEANIPHGHHRAGPWSARPVDRLGTGTSTSCLRPRRNRRTPTPPRRGQPSGTFSQLYLAVSKDNCQSFTDYPVYDGTPRWDQTNTVQFGDIFNNLAIDGAGNLYVIGTGFVATRRSSRTPRLSGCCRSERRRSAMDANRPARLGQTRRAPRTCCRRRSGGPQAGQLAIGYFQHDRTESTDPNDTKGQWTYSTAEIEQRERYASGFQLRRRQPRPRVPHGRDLQPRNPLWPTCRGGPSDRSLLDFTSVVLNPSGCPLFTFAGNTPASEANSQTWNYVTRQTTGCFVGSKRHRR